jgi:hypothetical protein
MSAWVACGVVAPFPACCRGESCLDQRFLGGAMDADRFDALTRALDSGSRRRMLGVLGGVALGAIAPLRDQLNGAAKKRKKKKKKCGKKCIPKSNCCTSAECGPGGTCEGGACTCAGVPPVACDDNDCDCGQVCRVDDAGSEPSVCQGGGCPETDFCSDPFIYFCGAGCACATSIDDATICADLFNVAECLQCESDAECTTALGTPAACIPLGPFCQCAPAVTAHCVAIGCPSGSPLRATDQADRSRGSSRWRISV